MASVIDICNIALSHIRARSINSMVESSTESQQCALHYEAARDTVLRAVAWQFNKKTAAGVLRVETPLQWTYAYQYPADCLKVRQVVGDYFFKDQTAEGLRNRFAYMSDRVAVHPEVPFAIENLGGVKVITTDQPEAYLIYSLKITDPTLFDVLFVDALAWYLSSKLAIPVIGGDFGRKMRDDALQMYQSMLSSAIATEQNEQQRPARRPARLVDVRI